MEGEECEILEDTGGKETFDTENNKLVCISFNEAILRGNVILQILVTVAAVLSVITSLHDELSLGSWSAWTVK